MTRRVPPLLTAGLTALAAVALVLAGWLAFRDDSNGVDSVTLDEPGEYSEATIAVNKDNVGEALDAALLRAELGDRFDGRPMLVNLWFSQCQPCKREMPALEAAYTSYGDTVLFVGVNPIDTKDGAESIAKEIGVDYPIVLDPNGEFATANGVTSYPMTFFVNADGTVARQIAGEMSADDISSGIALITGTPTP